MNTVDFRLGPATLTALPSGALWHAGAGLLCVSDLHLSRGDRVARGAGPLLPPYENRETLHRLSADIEATGAGTVICLGDSFDDLAGSRALDEACVATLARLQAGRRWIWIEGNHDPGPVELGGAHLAEVSLGGLEFRHIARPGAEAEISGHYHPKLSLPGAGAPRRCLVFDGRRCILPAYGAYTGGMRATAPPLRGLFGDRAFAILTGRQALLVPLPPASVAPAARRPPGSFGRFG